jgi:ribokinase
VTADPTRVVLVVGDANADLAGALARFPREGDDSPLRALGWGSGGSAANVATALARLGARVRLLARVGDDPAAEVALRAARCAGVDLDAIQRDDALATGLCFAAVSPGGERTFFSYRGANMALSLPDTGALFRDVGWLHIAGHALLEGAERDTAFALVAEARAREIAVSLDLCLPLLRASPAAPLALAPSLDVVFANEPELAALVAGGGEEVALPALAPLDAAVAALARPASLVVVKLGTRGCAVGGRARCAIPAFPVEARDSTGCGDAFVAGFLLAHLRGAPPDAAGRLANALGALTATRPGAADALPALDEVRALLRAHAATRDLDNPFWGREDG